MADDPAPLYRQLKPSKKASPERVAANQRLRLQGAMIEAVARHGYQGAEVVEIVALAGVSTKALYKHFGGKLECFLATFDLVVEQGGSRIAAAYRGGQGDHHDWHAGLVRAFDRFVAEIVDQPVASRVALVEVLAVGPAALERIERGEALFEQMICQSLAQAPQGPVVPPMLVKAVVHGIWYVARSRLIEGRERDLRGLGSQLLVWLLCYRDPALASLPCLQQGGEHPAGGTCGRNEPTPDGARLSDRAGGDRRLRLLGIAAQIAGREGYAALSMARLSRQSGMRVKWIADIFQSSERCFLGSLQMLSAAALSRALHCAKQAPDWPQAVCAATESLYRSVAEDPEFAHCAFVEIFAVGPAGAELRGTLMGGFAHVFAARAPARARPDALTAQLVAGAVWGIAHHHVLHGKAGQLAGLWPLAAYIALAPVIGAAEAAQAIQAWQAHGPRAVQAAQTA